MGTSIILAKFGRANILLERDAARWLEPMREWLKVASGLAEAAQSNDLPFRKSLARTSTSTRAKRALCLKFLGFSSAKPSTNSRNPILSYLWCPGWASNPHLLRDTILSRARIPIPPPGPGGVEGNRTPA